MFRTETYLSGRLVKEIDQVDVGPTMDKPYHQYVDGYHRWFLDGGEITEDAANSILGR